ncbi:MAG TPA: ABC transporter substrate-binding protein [Deltaproteobacteria bacterium]|nr:ABC transporter substrate-binding protein [Deltaproteobacteria bacterium]
MDRRVFLGAGVAASLLGVVGGVQLATRSASAPGGGRGRGWVSLTPALTETVFALGAGASLIGRSTYCTLPPEAQRLPTAGTSLTPDLEALASLGPAGVILEASAAAQIDRIARIAEVTAIPWLTLDDVVAGIAQLGRLFEAGARAHGLGEALQRSLSADAPAEGPRALLVLAGDDLGRGPVWFIKRNSLHGAAAHGAGLRDAVQADVAGLPQLSIEDLIALDPELILILSASSVNDAARRRLLHAFDALTPLTAPAQGRVGLLAGPEVLSVGPSILRLPQRLADEVARLGAG